ncbi:hypothetical protein LZ31DRAFT_104972 [Colletotrichum somersetense]|nr:hypothetical protein LZ31DRAFT_104972 [Colletotrichum somersetense]
MLVLHTRVALLLFPVKIISKSSNSRRRPLLRWHNNKAVRRREYMCVVTAPSFHSLFWLFCTEFPTTADNHPTRCTFDSAPSAGIKTSDTHGPSRLVWPLSSAGLSKPRPSSDRPAAAHRRP